MLMKLTTDRGVSLDEFNQILVFRISEAEFESKIWSNSDNGSNSTVELKRTLVLQFRIFFFEFYKRIRI